MANPYQGLGGRENDAKAWAYKQFQDILGRDPTQSELAQALPIFLGTDPHITDVAAGTAFVSSLANSPDQVYKRQQEQYGKEAPAQYGNVNQQFQALLGREATAEEQDHFGKLLASGQVDQYSLQDFLKQQPEYMKKADTQFQSELGGQLQASDQRYYQENIMPAIQSAYAKQGRSFEGTGFQNALALAAQGQNREREGFLANLSASQYGGRQAAARGDYESYVQNLQSRQNSSLTAPYDRQNQLTDFTMQKSAYEDYLRRYGKRQSNGAGIGTLVGAGIGALGAGLMTGGMGAGQGAMLGSQLGGAGGSFFNY